jgi:hypothetical protein
METVKFNCIVGSTDFTVPLGLEIWLDNHKFFDQDHIDQDYKIEHDIADDDGDHELRFVLKNKQSGHTQVDAEGNIVSDATVTISGVEFDGIDCQYLTTTLAQYRHDFNSTSKPIIDEFYGELGCNGTVTLKFSTPIYIWLLENM